MTRLKLRTIAALATAPSLLLAASGRADEGAPPTEREKALEKKVEDLQKQVEDLSKRMADGTNRAGDELDQRVSELEKLSKKDKDGLFGYWNKTLRMDSADGAFKLRVGGRIQNDWSWFWNTQDLEAATGKQIEAGTEFRRARLHVGGTIYKNVDFMAEYDFAGGAAKAREVWIGLIAPEVGHFQVGSFKEPFGFEENTSDLFITFIERSAPSEAFAPSYNTGSMLSNTCCGEQVTWQFGVFRDADDFGNDTGNARSGEYNFTGRIAGRPWIDKENEQYLHLGVAGSLRNPSSELVSFKAHPEMHLAPIVADTGALRSNEVRMFEGESAFVSGPFHAAAEYYVADVTGDGGPDAWLDGWSVAAGWFLTGESRPYKPSNAVFDRIVPKNNFDGDDGIGAWELAARYSRLDLNDGDVHGGQVNTMTFGVNWYLNPNTKVMLDWVRSHVKDAGLLDGLVMRFQVDF